MNEQKNNPTPVQGDEQYQARLILTEAGKKRLNELIEAAYEQFTKEATSKGNDYIEVVPDDK